MKTLLKTLFVYTSVISVLGCGGEEATTPKEVPEATVLVEISPEVTKSTGDLISAPEFDLSSANELRINLPASPSTTTRYFINICTDFSTEDNNQNNIKINYASCKLRTEITNSEQQFTLLLSTSELMLIAQIWPIEANAQPITTYWNMAEYGKQWPIEF